MNAPVLDRSNPYPFLGHQRRTDPVWHGSIMNYSEREFMRPADEWTLLDFESVDLAFRDQSLFTSSVYANQAGMIFGDTILGMVGKRHLAHRSLVAKAFRAKTLASWEPELIVPICDELVTSIKNEGAADLVTALTFEFPTRIVARLLGLPPEDLEMFRGLALDLTSIDKNVEPGVAAVAQLRPYFQQQIDKRRSVMTDDVIGDLVRAEIDGERLSDEAIIGFLLILLPAGLETTYRSSGNLLYLLLTHPEQLDRLRADRSLVSAAIEEGLRLEPPLITMIRQTTCDVELRGKTIPEGAYVNMALGSANRDETRWSDSETFDIGREHRSHLAFAVGAHSCLGLHLARMETRAALNGLLDHLDDLELVPDSGAAIEGCVFRSPNKLPVTFRPRQHD